MRGIKSSKVTKQLREVVSSLGVAEESRVKHEFRRLEKIKSFVLNVKKFDNQDRSARFG